MVLKFSSIGTTKPLNTDQVKGQFVKATVELKFIHLSDFLQNKHELVS